jgi:Asp-tRNA(Asn)/Glu-tRNA(Gln) amidotransferase A subunit family amidase
LAAYYLIMPSEVSSNLARFDAMRYGLRVDGGGSAEEVMALTREAGFGPEVKRRIILGTYALSSGYYDAYYGQAQKVRTLIARDFAAAFAQADVLVSPTTPTTAFPLGDKIDDPLAMYLNDLATIPANLAGVPGISVPAGLADADGLPVGVNYPRLVPFDDSSKAARLHVARTVRDVDVEHLGRADAVEYLDAERLHPAVVELDRQGLAGRQAHAQT